jgi:hypothetical protein
VFLSNRIFIGHHSQIVEEAFDELGCTHWTVRVRVKDCTAAPELAAVIFTLEVPAGVSGALGVVGVLVPVDWAGELPPPHPDNVNMPTNNSSRMILWQVRAESLRFLAARAIVSNPGAQNAAAASKGLFLNRKDAAGRNCAVLPAVCMVTTVV